MKTLLSTLLFLAVAQVAHADDTSLLGTWLNANSKSTGVTRLLIRQSGDKISVTTYGKCAPSDCAWGETPLNFTDTDNFQFGYVRNTGISNFTAQRVADDKLQLKLSTQISGTNSPNSTDETINMIKIPSGPNIYIKLQ